MRPAVNVSLACWPGLTHQDALSLAKQRAAEPLFGELSVAHIQLVPQSRGMLDESLIDSLRAASPRTAFRLHANVRVLLERRVVDLSGFELHRDWFERAACMHKLLGADAYSAHSGYREQATLEQMLEHARRCADLFGCPVAVEGQYPSPGAEPYRLLVSTWAEYQTLFESGVPYAVDLSHLNILARRSGRTETTLVRELLSCERCLEVHVSDNDGTGDWHQVCERAPWWTELLDHISPAAVVFSEGNHRRRIHERTGS